VYDLAGTAAAPRALVGADVIAWRPARGVFLLVERGATSPASLVDVPGVAGVWWYRGASDQPAGADVDGLQISYCYLDDDPVATAERLRPALGSRRSGGDGTPLLAAPFHVPVDYAWDRHVP
ncbi:MAG TPA: hypothetical protein VJM49_05850, partial [Acidimicrobiales bacterium]|nr:hypothetical protein [Acidimicrobiales bacterium]